MLKLKLQQFGAPGLTTPLRTETFENLQLNAGIFMKNFDYSSAANAGALKTLIMTAVAAGTNILGATRGGGSFVVTRDLRSPEADGKRYGYKGDKFVDSSDARLSTTLIEVTPENLKDALAAATITTDGLKKTIRMNTGIDPNDYLTNLCWIGDLSDGRLVLICLYNALNTADVNLTFTDKNEGTLPVEFHAHQSNVLDYDYAPFEIVYFDTTGTLGELTFTSAAGTNVGGTKITTEATLSTGQHFVYKVGTSSVAPSVSYHETVDYSWTEWDGSSDIAVGTGANGKKATIAVVDTNSRAVSSGSVTLTVKTT